MTPELTPREIEQIKREAEDYKSDFIISFWGDKITHDDIESTYAAALTSERLKHKAEIQAYRDFLKYVVTARDNVSKEMMAVFAENLIVKYQKPLTMKQGIYQADGRLWEDWPEPIKPSGKIKFTLLAKRVYERDLKEYNCRPSISVHPDLQKVWEVGKCYVRDVDYYLMNEGGTTALPMAVPIEAVPILAKQPEQTKSEQVETVFGEWQLCPKCNGQGLIEKPPYLAAEVTEWVSTGEVFTCDVCNGAKILARPLLTNDKSKQTKSEQGEKEDERIKLQPIRVRNLSMPYDVFVSIENYTLHNNTVVADTLFQAEDDIEADFFHSKKTNIRVKNNYAVDLVIRLLRMGIMIHFLDDSAKHIRKISPPLYNKYYATHQQ